MISTTSSGKGAGAPPPPKSASSSLGLIFMFPVIMIIVMDPTLRTAMGSAVGGAFNPVFGFGGFYPVWTLFICSVILVLFTTVVRHFFTDWLGMGKQKHTSSWVSKQYRDIRLRGNVTKMKKLQEYQSQMMSSSADSMGGQMKTTIVTIVVAMAIFLWLGVFMSTGVVSHHMSVPWAPSVDFNAPGPFLHIMPSWILLYSVLSLPLGQLVGAMLKIVSFRKKIAKLDSTQGA